jgi:Carboxypeptidase regulatory-like domain/TonB dependent receptor/TonB-dependent Receptor Plug Domain
MMLITLRCWFAQATRLAVLVVASALLGLAQVDTGSIRGIVRDESGRVVPRAAVKISQPATGFSQSSISGADGSYIFTAVRVGTYTVTASLPGFENAVLVNFELHVQQNAAVDLTLAPRQVTAITEVRSQSGTLQTEEASVGQVIGSHEIESLPLNGRNYTLLTQLTTGVTTAAQESRGLLASGSFVANGMTSLHNNYLLDGIDNNNNTVDFLNGAAYAVRPPVDAIREFKVQTSGFSAEFGRAGGAVLNAVLKSGTNQFHGGAWEFIRNDALDGTDFFLNANGQNKGKFRRNQFGGMLGGPITIPHIYTGKNRTFFFADYEGTRIRQAIPFTSTVPTAGERASGYTDFTDLITGQSGSQADLLGRNFPLGTVFDPATTRAITTAVLDPVTNQAATRSGFVREPFAGNKIPTSRLDPVAVKLLGLFPAPSRPGLLNNYVSNPVKTDDINSWDVRVDHNFSDRDQTFMRISQSSEPVTLPTPLGGLAGGAQSFAAGDQTNNAINVAWSETHVFSATMVNEFRAGYHRIHTVRLQPFADQAGINAQYGVPGVPDSPPNGGLTQINISGLAELGGHNNLPLDEINGTLQLTENVSKQVGSHSLRTGVEYQRIKVGVNSAQFPHGRFVYNGQYTTVPNGNTANTGIAQFLLSPVATTVANGIDNVGGANDVSISPLSQQDYRRPYYALYVQDNWKVSRRLTLNLGLRWDYYQLAQDRYGAQANFIPGAPFNGAQYLIDSRHKDTPLSASFLTMLQKDGIQLVYTDNRSLGITPKNNFGPRVGFAYQVTPKLVIRGAYGIFYSGVFNSGDGANLGNNYPFAFGLDYVPATAVSPLTPDASIGTLGQGFRNVPIRTDLVNTAGLNLRGIQYDYKTPYSQGINLTLQYQLPGDQSASIGYVGTLGRHLFTSPGTNLPSLILPPNENVRNYVPFPEFARNSSYSATIGNSFYHSLQMKYERQFSRDFGFLAAYTWSKLRSDSSDTLFTTVAYRGPDLPGFGIKGDYQLGSFDIRHALHLSGSYVLPFGRGKRFLAYGGIVDGLVGGWMLNGVMTLQTGNPFTVGCTISTTAGNGCNALLVPGQDMYAGARTPDRWLNAAAFANPRVATSIGQTDYGPLGGAPTQAIGPGFHRGDMSLSKRWQLAENSFLEFRAETFNLTNTPNFARPSALNFSSTRNFGQITATRDNPDSAREFQFGLKVSF